MSESSEPSADPQNELPKGLRGGRAILSSSQCGRWRNPIIRWNSSGGGWGVVGARAGENKQLLRTLAQDVAG